MPRFRKQSKPTSPDGGIGRRAGLKHQWIHFHPGSIPGLGTKKTDNRKVISLLWFLFPHNFSQCLQNSVNFTAFYQIITCLKQNRTIPLFINKKDAAFDFLVLVNLQILITQKCTCSAKIGGISQFSVKNRSKSVHGLQKWVAFHSFEEVFIQNTTAPTGERTESHFRQGSWRIRL